MIEVNKNMLASAIPALGKLVCRTSPLAICKSIKVEAAEGKLRLSTCGLNEEVSFELETGSNEVFSCMVGFDEFRDAVKSGRNKAVEVAFEAGLLLVGDRYLMTVKDVEWPDFTPKTEVKSCELPKGVVGMFARAAQIVDRNEPRAILRGINLSADGITVTNGKELLNYDCPLELESSITIPVMIGVGFTDLFCPPSAVYTIYNELRGPKFIFNKIKYGHAGSPPEYVPIIHLWLSKQMQGQ